MTTPPMPMVQVFAPDGTLGDIPYDRLHEAISAGAKPASKMQAPDGTMGYVPADKRGDALKAGGKAVPIDLSDADGAKPGFWSHAAQSLKSMIPAPPASIGDAAKQGLSASMGMAAPLVGAGQEAIAASQRGHGLPYSAAAGLSTLAGVNPQRMEQAAAQGDTAGVLGEAAVPAGLAVVGPVAAEVVGKAGSAASAGRDAISAAIRDPKTGKIHSPYELAMDKLFPDPYAPDATPARTIPKGTNYGQYLQDKAEAAKAMEKAHQSALKADAEAREAVPLKNSPYYAQNQARIAAQAEAAKPVPLTQSPYYAQNQAAAAAQAEAAKPVPITQSPNYDPEAFKQGVTGRSSPVASVVTPGNPPAAAVASEGRPATWTNQRVNELAGQGNRDAIQQMVLRGMKLPENARYVAGDANFSGVTSNPRSVTTFAPDGTPIQQGGPIKLADVQSGIKVENASGSRWAVSKDGKYRVPIPKNVPDSLIQTYAAPQLLQQMKMHELVGK
jgi:hypothetical protein